MTTHADLLKKIFSKYLAWKFSTWKWWYRKICIQPGVRRSDCPYLRYVVTSIIIHRTIQKNSPQKTSWWSLHRPSVIQYFLSKTAPKKKAKWQKQNYVQLDNHIQLNTTVLSMQATMQPCSRGACVLGVCSLSALRLHALCFAWKIHAGVKIMDIASSCLVRKWHQIHQNIAPNEQISNNKTVQQK